MLRSAWCLAALWTGTVLAAEPVDEAKDPAQGGQTSLQELLAPKPYDATPFLKALRPKVASSPKAKLGDLPLGDLPLYQMEIELDPLRCRYQGQMTVLFKNPWKEPLTDIVLRTYPNVDHLRAGDELLMTLADVNVNGRPAELVRLHPTSWAVRLGSPLQPGARVRVGLSFQASVPRLPEGADTPMAGAGPADLTQQLFGKEQPGGYGVFACGAGMLNLGFFYPIIPARADGAWDTQAPSGLGDVAHFDVANYLVKLRLPNDQQVASSGLEVGEKPQGSGAEAHKEVFLLGAGLRNFALQISSRYEIKESKAGDVRVRYFHTAETAARADETLKIAVDSLKAFEKMFGPYPWPELDVADAPLIGGAGGMEYPGLVTVAMSLTTASGAGGAPTDIMGLLMQQTHMVEFVIAHEVAHQWWHALVGSDSNRHPFMDEALANYAAVLYFEHRHGPQRAAEQLENQLRMPAQLFYAMGGQDGRVDRPTSAFGSALEYSALVYGKGALFYDALRKAVGGPALLKGLRTLARTHAFRQAGPEDLVAALGKGTGQPKKVKELYARWIEGAHGREDIGEFSLDTVLQDLAKQMQGFHNFKMDGVDPAMLQLLQQALQGVMDP
jgi:hypothetical protein